MKIIYCINKSGMEGLGASVHSIFNSCSRIRELSFYFLCNNLDADDKMNIRSLVSPSGDANFIDFDAREMFGHLRSLHGDWTTYGKLLIPRIFSEPTLYLDSDTLVMIDVLQLNGFDFGGKKVAVQAVSMAKYTNDRKLFYSLGLEDVDYFNAGVMLFNNEVWGDNCRIDVIANRRRKHLKACDQTLFNLYLKGRFIKLPENFNNIWRPRDKEFEVKGIVHFAGSPKPWDLFGESHAGYSMFNRFNPPYWASKYCKLSLRRITRAWRTKGSIARFIFKRGRATMPYVAGLIDTTPYH